MTGQDAFPGFSVLAFTFALSLALTGLATAYARWRGLLDHPGDRHSHTESTPRGGGAGLVTAFLAASLLFAADAGDGLWLKGVVPCIAFLGVTGWWDDHASLSARLRFFVQLAVSLYLLWFSASYGWAPGLPMLLLGGLFIIWMTNLYNFMDGSNGMAGLQGVFAATVLAVLYHLADDGPFALIALLLAASCAGFLPWNLGRARVFMGDVGSLALGFTFAFLLLYGTTHGELSPPLALLVMMTFLTDATLTLLSRVIRGERWYNPHRQHLYQQLIAHGWSHGRVATLYQALNLALVLPGIAISVRFPALAWAAALVVALILVAGWYFLIGRIGVPVQAEQE